MINIQNKLRNFNTEDFLDPRKLHRLILEIGICERRTDQQPKHLHKYINPYAPWQNPKQLTKLLLFLAEYDINTYFEIGVYRCGTFLLMTEYLDRLNGLEYALGVDVSTGVHVEEYKSISKDINTVVKKISSRSTVLIEEISSTKFDLILIDGNHGTKAVIEDFETYRNNGSIILFHDISSVCKDAWDAIKKLSRDEFDFYEITDQYKTVNKDWFGFGILIKKDS